jgi:hypothetical protein
MSTNQPTGKPETKTTQDPTPGGIPDKAGFKPNPGAGKSESDSKREADKSDPKKN